MKIIKLSSLLLTMVVSIAIPVSALAVDTHADDRYEDELVRTIDTLTQKGLDPALERIEKLVAENPNFKLAQLIYADLLMAKTQPLTGFGAHANAPKKILQGLRDEAKQRWSHFISPPNRNAIPASIVKLSAKTKYAVVVELDHYRVYVFENKNGRPTLVKDYYASIGKAGADKYVEGDNKTPIGVYNITEFISDKKLPDFYGTGALPIDYPNKWDRRLKKTGYGIWLHGTPIDTYSRPPLASEGCVALSNDDFTNLRNLVKVRQSPVVITRKITWLEPDAWLTEQQKHINIIENWNKDWESLDSARYLSHYSKDDFRSGKRAYQWWASHKTKVNARKSFIKVKLNDINIFRYPGVENMLEFSFQQDYQSSNYNKIGNKRQYWQKNQNQQWQIIYEGPA